MTLPINTARATNKLATRSNRILGESPNNVLNRKIVGAKTADSDPRRIPSESIFVSEYTDSGFTADSSLTKKSDAPYTLHDDAKINRGTPHWRATFASMRVAARFTSTANSLFSSQAGSPTIPAK